ncbi:transporter substrate-binding domain-containing protein [Desulfococcaceae bacterium HSG7]|nr:transporter substrate-binding domain-containing protein [Desulfococcaceae bacterium HSG9]MDM8553236.1 transporter substrate-binding domain-containing protein [Desulfococcaceae bacterium HSG7]
MINMKGEEMRKHILMLAVMFVAFSAHAQEITIGTEDFPPFSYEGTNGKVTGLSTEVVQAVLDEIGVEAEIGIYPWPRAFNMALVEKNHLLFSVSRTKKREKMFKWVGTVCPYNVYMYKLKSRKDIKIDSIPDINKYSTGSVRKDIKIEYLINKGITNVDYVLNDEQNIKKMVKGRVDVIPYHELGFAYKVNLLKYKGVTMDDFEKVYFLKDISKELYMAFGTKTSDRVVEKFRKGLEKIKRDGAFDRIHKKYLQ